MHKIIEKIIKGLIYASFFVPIVVGSESFIFPFIVPKILLLRSLVTIMTGLFALLLISNWSAYRPRFTPVTIAVGAFILSFFLSTIFGVDAYHSFWDNHERMLGFFTVLHYAILFYISSFIFKSWSDWEVALKVFLGAGTIVMLVGLFQVIKPDFLLNNNSARVASTLGNSIYVGGYGLFLFCVAALLGLKEKNIWWKAGEAVMLALGLVGIFISGSRGALIGWLAGIFVALVLYGLWLPKEKMRWRQGIGLTIAVLLIALGTVFVFRKSDFVQKIPALNRVVLTSIDGVKNSPRYFAWQIAVQSWQERPILGWGPNNYFYSFNKYYNPRSLEFGYGETWFDNAHNIILNTMAVQGTVGILTYLGMFVAGIYSLARARKRGGDLHLAVIGIGFLVAHLVQNVTVFENPTSYLYFMVWLGLVNSLTARAPGGAPEPVTASKPINPAAVAAMGLVVAVIVFVFNIQPARANHQTLLLMRDMIQTRHIDLPAIERVFAFSSPHIDDIRSDVGRTVGDLLFNNYQTTKPEDAQKVINVVQGALEENLNLHPLDLRNHMAFSQLMQLQTLIYKDARYLMQSEVYITDAVKLSPHRQQLLFNLANIKLQLGKNQEAIAIYEFTIKDDPKVTESYWRLAHVYTILGKRAQAEQIILDALNAGIVFNAYDQQMIANILSAPAATSTPAAKK